jgi:hypothetical protein
MLARYSSLSHSRRMASDFFRLDAVLHFLPFITAIHAAIWLAERLRPFWAKPIATFVSSACFLPLRAIDIFSLVTVLARKPVPLAPATKAMLYAGRKALILACSMASKSVTGHRATTEKVNAESPYLSHARCKDGLWCLPRARSLRCLRHLRFMETADPIYCLPDGLVMA